MAKQEKVTFFAGHEKRSAPEDANGRQGVPRSQFPKGNVRGEGMKLQGYNLPDFLLFSGEKVLSAIRRRASDKQEKIVTSSLESMEILPVPSEINRLRNPILSSLQRNSQGTSRHLKGTFFYSVQRFL